VLPAVPQTVLRAARTFRATSAFIITPPTENRVEMVKTTADALKEAGVTFILVLSMPIAEKPTSTLFGGQFCKIETYIKGFVLPYAIIRAPFLMDNFLASSTVESIREQGRLQAGLVGPVISTAPWTPSCAKDVGVAAAAILTAPQQHNAKTYTMASPAESYDSIAAAFSSALGTQVVYDSLSYTRVKACLLAEGHPEWQVKGLLEYWRLVDEGAALMDQRENEDFLQITGTEPMTVEAWVQDQVRCGKV